MGSHCRHGGLRARCRPDAPGRGQSGHRARWRADDQRDARQAANRVESTFVHGKRVTDAKTTVEVVEMVLSGRVNQRDWSKRSTLKEAGRIGLSGKDANLLICDQTDAALGLVGTPAEVDTTVLKTLFESDMIPVIAPLGSGREGETSILMATRWPARLPPP